MTAISGSAAVVSLLASDETKKKVERWTCSMGQGRYAAWQLKGGENDEVARRIINKILSDSLDPAALRWFSVDQLEALSERITKYGACLANDEKKKIGDLVEKALFVAQAKGHGQDKKEAIAGLLLRLFPDEAKVKAHITGTLNRKNVDWPSIPPSSTEAPPLLTTREPPPLSNNWSTIAKTAKATGGLQKIGIGKGRTQPQPQPSGKVPTTPEASHKGVPSPQPQKPSQPQVGAEEPVKPPLQPSQPQVEETVKQPLSQVEKSLPTEVQPSQSQVETQATVTEEQPQPQEPLPTQAETQVTVKQPLSQKLPQPQEPSQPQKPPQPELVQMGAMLEQPKLQVGEPPLTKERLEEQVRVDAQATVEQPQPQELLPTPAEAQATVTEKQPQPQIEEPTKEPIEQLFTGPASSGGQPPPPLGGLTPPPSGGAAKDWSKFIDRIEKAKNEKELKTISIQAKASAGGQQLPQQVQEAIKGKQKALGISSADQPKTTAAEQPEVTTEPKSAGGGLDIDALRRKAGEMQARREAKEGAPSTSSVGEQRVVSGAEVTPLQALKNISLADFQKQFGEALNKEMKKKYIEEESKRVKTWNERAKVYTEDKKNLDDAQGKKTEKEIRTLRGKMGGSFAQLYPEVTSGLRTVARDLVPMEGVWSARDVVQRELGSLLVEILHDQMKCTREEAQAAVNENSLPPLQFVEEMVKTIKSIRGALSDGDLAKIGTRTEIEIPPGKGIQPLQQPQLQAEEKGRREEPQVESKIPISPGGGPQIVSIPPSGYTTWSAWRAVKYGELNKAESKTALQKLQTDVRNTKGKMTLDENDEKTKLLTAIGAAITNFGKPKVKPEQLEAEKKVTPTVILSPEELEAQKKEELQAKIAARAAKMKSQEEAAVTASEEAVAKQVTTAKLIELMKKSAKDVRAELAKPLENAIKQIYIDGERAATNAWNQKVNQCDQVSSKTEKQKLRKELLTEKGEAVRSLWTLKQQWQNDKKTFQQAGRAAFVNAIKKTTGCSEDESKMAIESSAEFRQLLDEVIEKDIKAAFPWEESAKIEIGKRQKL